MKKLLSLLLCLIALVTVCSCTKEEKLVVYTEAGFAPFEYVSGGKITGVDVEIMELVGEKLNKKVVFENVAFAMEVLHKSKKQIRKQVPQILSLVGITDKAHKYPEELSAGEQQRVAIARAIINNPMVLIADEPTGNLDPDTAAEIMDLLEQINLRGTTIVMVTHAKDIVDRMKKRVIAIEKGKIVRDSEGIYNFAEEVSGLE